MKVNSLDVGILGGIVQQRGTTMLDHLERVIDYLGNGDFSDPVLQADALAQTAAIGTTLCDLLAHAAWEQLVRNEIIFGAGKNEAVANGLQAISAGLSARLNHAGNCRLADALLVTFAASIAKVVVANKLVESMSDVSEALCAGSPGSFDKFKAGDVPTGKGMLAGALHDLDEKGITLPRAAHASLDEVFGGNSPDEAATVGKLMEALGFDASQLESHGGGAYTVHGKANGSAEATPARTVPRYPPQGNGASPLPR